MTDREMLELAAKAAGYYFHGLRVGLDYENCFVSTTNDPDDWIIWDPLTDDGDALRLAVYLEFEIDITSTGVAVRTRCGLKVLVNKTEEPDLCAAARLAITRAAAEIGRQMEEQS